MANIGDSSGRTPTIAGAPPRLCRGPQEPARPPSEEVHIRLRFPFGGVAVDYRAPRRVAGRVAVELQRYGVEVTIDDDAQAAHPPLPNMHAWE
ncbi:hypothetical protein [Nocardia wallacei]|uniref:hypothetical protein n=1 Tax=Nocardia wallacei TaxID=480035 RepID=UPI002454F32E|nr:hypothetical protein [Nocardia wallacei]